MTEARFYHLTRRSVDQALPELLEKCYQRGWRALVRAPTPELVESLAVHLWSGQDSFLPHGTEKDGRAEEQPIWITHKDDRPNNASVLFLVHGADAQNGGDYDLVCELFDGRDPHQEAAAREKWRAYKAAGWQLTYWQETDIGWENPLS